MNYEPFTSIEIPTLAHSSLTYLPIRPYIYVPIRHYICREPSTNQLFFMQNKPNFTEGKIDAKCLFTEDYEE